MTRGGVASGLLYLRDGSMSGILFVSIMIETFKSRKFCEFLWKYILSFASTHLLSAHAISSQPSTSIAILCYCFLLCYLVSSLFTESEMLLASSVFPVLLVCERRICRMVI